MAPILTFLSKWTSFLRALFSKFATKETKLNNFYSPDELKKMLLVPEFRAKIAKWVEDNLRPLEDNQKYLELVKKSGFVMTGAILQVIFSILNIFVVIGSRGHGKGHHYRDIAHAYALACQSFKNKAIYTNEAIAGFLAGAYHELAAGVMVRYHDKKYSVGHAEVGAWMFYWLLKGILPEHILLLVAYSIARHTTYLSEFTSEEDGTLRKVWNDQVFQHDGRYVRIAPWICAMADRLDNLGAPHFGRHIDATADGTIFGGANLRPDGGWDNLDQSLLQTLLTPNFKTVDGKATTFIHLLGYGASAVALPPVYNKWDHLLPIMGRMVARKHAEIILILNSLNDAKSTNPGLEKLVSMLDRIEMASINDVQFNLIKTAWESLSDAEQAKWGSILAAVDRCYSEWIATLKATVEETELFPDFDNASFFEELG